jgi:molecular chaperone GrpE
MTDEHVEKNDLPEDEEDIIEFEYNADGEEDLKATLKKLRKDLKEAREKEKEYLTNWQRERADFVNYKKDEDSRRASYSSHARERFAEDLLPVLDAYDMAFQNKEAWEKVDKNWRTGVEYIHSQLLKVLSDNGIEEIPTKEGDIFDPNLHEPMGTVEIEDEAKNHTIAQVMQKGYKNGARIVRPARVKIFEKK